MIPYEDMHPTGRPCAVRNRRGQMAEEGQTTKKDNEPVRIAVWYDYI